MKNPFRAYRAEQLQDAVWRYYVKEPFDKLLGPKPLIYEGGRGSGKTMFFICNSWRQRFEELSSSRKSPVFLFQTDSFIGIYYRADAPFVGSFFGKDVSDDKWKQVFSTYFNVVICKEIFFFLKTCISHELIKEKDLEVVYKTVSKRLHYESENIGAGDIIEFLDSVMDEIERFSNNIITELSILFNPGTLVKTTIESLRTINYFRNTNFHILIDEYETLNKDQQSQINTLLKMSSSWLVYDLSVKSKGIKTFETITGETIQSPHDFTHFRPETQINDQEYITLLVKICEKRFKEHIINESNNKDFLNIKFYLGNYSMSQELSKLNIESKAHLFKNKLREIIDDQVEDTDERVKYHEELVECDILHSRMHLCLLLREGPNAIAVRELYDEFIKWKNEKSMRYADWLHNMQLAIVFLLCREAGINKQYCGFNVFCLLSSGVIRYFLELCEHAFDFAFANGFTFDDPRPLTAHEQTRAARYVSRYKITDIGWYRPHGKILKRFIITFGRILQELQTNSNATLGEPEQNHFYTKSSEINVETADLLSSAIMHNVLQERLPSKEKESELSIETNDYHLNHIYCPYFKISYRRKRKLYISPYQLENMFLGPDANVKKAAKEILKKHKINYMDTTPSNNDQVSLFED